MIVLDFLITFGLISFLLTTGIICYKLHKFLKYVSSKLIGNSSKTSS